MMQSEAPEVTERLTAAYMSYITARDNAVRQSGGTVLRRVLTDDSGMYEIIDISVEAVETSSFMKNDRDAIFVALKGCWAVSVNGVFTEVDEQTSFMLPRNVPFRISPAGLEAKALLVINGSR